MELPTTETVKRNHSDGRWQVAGPVWMDGMGIGLEEETIEAHLTGGDAA
jgi:hypothetical protein